MAELPRFDDGRLSDGPRPGKAALTGTDQMTHRGKTIDTRGRKFGGDTPLICAPLVGRTRERLLVEAKVVAAKKPDVIEWRVDYFEGVGDTTAVLGAGKALRDRVGDSPVIFTCRSVKEGGEPIAMDDEGVVRLYDAVGASGLVDFLDFEMGNAAEHVRRVLAAARAHATRVILSYHNFDHTPARDFLVGRFLEAERLGADVAKVAVMPRDRADVLTLLAATAEADAKAHIPLVSMSMGPLGAVTRMIGGAFGSTLSFAVGEGSSASGQLPIEDLRTVHDILRRARAAR
jgi:3-dehydroquinate dehydratase-1